MLADLLATDGVEEVCELGSRVGFMAFHGGSLEAVTDVVAEAAAERAGASFYAIRQPWGFRWHIPSHQLDPAASPALASFLDHVEVAVAIHGWGSNTKSDRPLLLGGTNREAAVRIGAALREALPGYEVVDDIDAIPKRVRGLDPRNPVNRPPHGGVQLELTPRVRGLPPFWPREQIGLRCPDTRALVGALAEAVSTLP